MKKTDKSGKEEVKAKIKNKMSILKVPVFKVSKKNFLKKVRFTISQNQQLQASTVNPEFLVEAQKDREFFKILQQTFNVPDGVGVLWAGYFKEKTRKARGYLGHFRRMFWFLFSLILVPFWQKIFNVFPEKISGSDIFWDLLTLAERKKWRVFLLGGGRGVAKLTAQKIKIRFPQLKVVEATSGGVIEKLKTPHLVKKIQITQPQLLFVAFGSPKQEKWIAYNLKNLPKPLVAIGVGGTFDFVAGKIRRAPKIMRSLGLEWFWRLILEPKKRLKRIWIAVFVFPWLVFKDSA
ncbi:WecB/TagA/CpsF family glycosyltransferase [bacterium]|nr:WecB/TagA/CpsF family glycosyltransferase [bacterium]